MTRAEVKFQQAEDYPAKPRDGGYPSIDASDGFSGFRPAVNLHKARLSSRTCQRAQIGMAEDRAESDAERKYSKTRRNREN
jgi:hypothetical protein